MPNLGQKLWFLVSCDLEIWQMTFKNNRAPLLCYFKLCASFCSHIWIQTGVTVRKWLIWVLTAVTLTFDLWPGPFAWTSLLSLVIIPENFMMIRWRQHSGKGVTDGRTDVRTDRQMDGWTERSVLIAAWSQLKIRTIWQAWDLWKLAQSCKQLHLLCPSDLWIIPGTALISRFHSSWGALKSTE